MIGTYWTESKDGDPNAYAMYRRHYSARNKKPKIRQFIGPGEKMVLIGWFCQALFVWRKFIDDSGQHGVNCAVFRNESEHRSSDMICEAVEWARLRWGGARLYTMVDAEKTKKRRGKRSKPGKCFIAAGWRECGVTTRGLVILELPECASTPNTNGTH